MESSVTNKVVRNIMILLHINRCADICRAYGASRRHEDVVAHNMCFQYEIAYIIYNKLCDKPLFNTIVTYLICIHICIIYWSRSTNALFGFSQPENIMCQSRTSHQVKLIDFGLAQKLHPDKTTRVLFGTPEFIPPEIISYEPIGLESDMWSVGVICYVL